MDKAKEYERRMISRVQYLVQEERKVLKKIDSTKQLAEKTSKLKEQKIQDLRYKLEHERREQNELRKKIEKQKKHREENQAKKLKKAYDEMIRFETQRKMERDEKERLKEESNLNKMMSMAKNFQTAEIIRSQNIQTKQALQFNKQLKKIEGLNRKHKQLQDMSDGIETKKMTIQELEEEEARRIEALQVSLNEHARLQGLNFGSVKRRSIEQ